MEKALEAGRAGLHGGRVGLQRQHGEWACRDDHATCVVLWKRAEVGGEDFVRVWRVDQHHLRARRLVGVHADGDAPLGHLLRALQDVLVLNCLEFVEALRRRCRRFQGCRHDRMAAAGQLYLASERCSNADARDER